MRLRWSSAPATYLTPPRLLTRVALGIGVFAGLLTALFYGLLRPDPNVSFDIYYYAAETALAGNIEFDTPSGAFVYPPVVSLAFTPFVLLWDLPTAFAIYRLLNVLLALGMGYVTVRFVERSGAALRTVDRVLVVAFFVCTVYPIATLVLGQVSILLAAGLVFGVVWLETDHERLAGASFALAAAVKVSPTFWGVWFLRERAWQAILTALAVGVGSIVLGLLVFGLDTYLRYLTFVRTNRVRIMDFATTVSPEREFLSLMRPLSSLLPWIDPRLYPFIALLIVAPVILLLYSRVRGPEGRLVAVLATVIGVIMVLPTSQDLNAYQVYFPAIASLYLLEDARVRNLIAAGLVVISFNFDPGEVDTVLGLFAPPSVHALAMSIVTPVLTFASMPLYGLALMFFGCALFGYSLDEQSRFPALWGRE